MCTLLKNVNPWRRPPMNVNVAASSISSAVRSRSVRSGRLLMPGVNSCSGTPESSDRNLHTHTGDTQTFVKSDYFHRFDGSINYCKALREKYLDRTS